MEGLQGGTRATARRALTFVVLTACAALGLALATGSGAGEDGGKEADRVRRSRSTRRSRPDPVTSRSVTRSRSDTRSSRSFRPPTTPTPRASSAIPRTARLRAAPDRRERGVSRRDVLEPDRPTAPEQRLRERAGRRPGYRTMFPLHVKYSGSQLDYAVSYLKTHKNVRLVSLMIGANDLFVCEETTADHCACAGRTSRRVGAASPRTTRRSCRRSATRRTTAGRS